MPTRKCPARVLGTILRIGIEIVIPSETRADAVAPRAQDDKARGGSSS